MIRNYSWYNGQIMLSDEVSISANDLGLLRGYGLFDYFRTYNRKPFQWDWYWQRFSNSAKILKIPLNITQEEVAEILVELTMLSEHKEIAFRFLLTGGDAPDSSTMIKPNLLIRSEAISEVSAETYEKGISIITHSYARDMPELKSTDYKRVLSLQEHLKEVGASDVLYHTDEVITEMSRSNVFLVKNGKIKTPKVGILKGITRRTTMELVKPDFEIEESDILVSELYEADEVFTTSTNKKILAVSKIDGKEIGNGLAGSVSKELLKRFEDFTENW